MDLRRHVTAGRLSELVGSAGIDSDKVIRTMGWRRVAEQELPTLAPETRQYLQAYADGVNAYIKQAGSPEKMSLEYTVLARRNPGYRVEPWTPVDSLAWLKAMAWDLRGDYKDELARARLSRTTRSIKQVEPALPALSRRPQPADPLPAGLAAGVGADRPGGQPRAGGPDGAAHRRTGGAAVDSALASVDAVPASLGRGDGIGSNSWVVSGSRTTTGKPLLANDPHLGLAIPGIWGQVNLQCRTRERRVPVPGLGLHVLGSARCRHRPQRQGRLGDDQPRPRRHRLLPRAGLRGLVPARPGQPAARDSARRSSRSPAAPTCP